MKALDELQDSDLLDWDEGDPEIVRDIGKEAVEFLLSHKWCKEVKSILFDRGFSEVAVFYAEIEPDLTADRFIWVIVGDTPPAYFNAYDTNGAEALDSYVWKLSRWVAAAKAGLDTSDLMPILARRSFKPLMPSPEIIDLTERRLRIISKYMLSHWKDEIRPSSDDE